MQARTALLGFSWLLVLGRVRSPPLVIRLLLVLLLYLSVIIRTLVLVVLPSLQVHTLRPCFLQLWIAVLGLLHSIHVLLHLHHLARPRLLHLLHVLLLLISIGVVGRWGLLPAWNQRRRSRT